MQELEGFLELAGITGVFVGFGTLIALRSAHAAPTGHRVRQAGGPATVTCGRPRGARSARRCHLPTT
jgi:hypothetical protein